jgi:AcrR family transcriptional regulator
MKRTVSTRTARIQGASSERRERQKQELRRLILQAAGELFLEKGYENFSLRQVAERIGYSATTIYLYFQNKDDLILATVQDGFEAFDRQMESIAVGKGNPLQRIEALGRAYIEFGMQNPALYRLMFMQRSDFYIMPRLDGEAADSLEAQVSTQAAPATKSAKQKSASAKAAASKTANVDAEQVDHDQPRTLARTLLVSTVREAMDARLLRDGDPIIVADVLWAGAHGLVSLALSPLMSNEHSQRMIEPLLGSLIEGVKRHKK